MDRPVPPDAPAVRPGTGRLRLALLLLAGICAAVLFYLLGHELVGFLEKALDLQRLAANRMLGHPAVWLVLFAYMLLLAVPYVPGAELGVVLLAIFGAPIAPFVYGASVGALMLAYAVGRMLPSAHVAALVERLAMVPAGGRVRHRWLQALMTYRCVALAVALNTPGNMVLGGGGGIALAAGVSRLFSVRAFMLTVCLAVAPVPLGVVLVSLLGA